MARPRNSAIGLENLNELGPRLAELRKAAGLSQNGIAAALQRAGWDVAKNSVSAIENRLRSITDIEIRMWLEACGKRWRDL